MRAVRSAVALLVAGTLLAGCGEREEKVEEVERMIDRTRREAASFVYRDVRPDLDARVNGIAEDDFRVKALVSVAGKDAYEEIIYDDTLAMRFLDPGAVDALIDPAMSDVDTGTELPGIDVFTALRSGRWVVDEGAAPLVAAAPLAKQLGRDPVFDAVTALEYTKRTLREAQGIQEWDEDDLNPAYARSEDTFPKPEKGSGVTRWDLIRPDLPAAGSGGAGGGEEQIIATRHFRKMAIYEKGGRVIRVVEKIEVVGKQLEELTDFISVSLETSEFGPEVRQAYDDLVANVPKERLGGQLLAFLNLYLSRSGQEPILVRNMSLDLSDSASGQVALPTDQVVKGSLEAMVASADSKAAESSARPTPAGGGGEGGGTGEGEAPGGATDGEGGGEGDAPEAVPQPSPATPDGAPISVPGP